MIFTKKTDVEFVVIFIKNKLINGATFGWLLTLLEYILSN